MKTSAEPAHLVRRLGFRPQAGGGASRAWLVVLVVGLVVSMVPVTGLGQTGGDAVDALTGPPWRAWTSETVKDQPRLEDAPEFPNEGFVWGYTNLEMGPEDQIHLVYGWRPHNSAGELEYAWQEDGEWRFDTVAHKALPDDLAVDGEGRPWLVWTKDAESFVATRNGTGEDWWRMSLANDGRDMHVDVGPHGLVHVSTAQLGADPDPVKHGTFDPDAPGEGWSWSVVGGDELGWRDLAVGPDGRAHIVWLANDNQVRYATQTEEGWSLTPLDFCDRDNAVDVAPDGTVHVACKARGTPAGVLHATREPDSEAWSVDIASDGSQLTPSRNPSEVGHSTDLVVDEEGVPHIAYPSGFNPVVRDDPTRPARPVYAVKANGPCPVPAPVSGVVADPPVLRAAPQNPCRDWHVQAVDHDGTRAAWDASLALDGEGVPRLAYTYMERLASEGCDEVTNPCWDVRLAQPVASALSQAGS